jgi:hypothetical protein
MNKHVALITLLLMTGCVQNIRQSPLVGNCINWKPYSLNEVSVRIDSIPESVLITPDSKLEQNLLQLVGKAIFTKSVAGTETSRQAVLHSNRLKASKSHHMTLNY